MDLLSYYDVKTLTLNIPPHFNELLTKLPENLKIIIFSETKYDHNDYYLTYKKEKRNICLFLIK
jgi:hypothetical protein